jgi:hypothetical protein
VPLGLDQPYWIEDPDFDIEFHARELVFPACGGGRLGHRTTLGADGMGGDPVEQRVGHRVGLLLEHKVADAVQRLEAVSRTPAPWARHKAMSSRSFEDR